MVVTPRKRKVDARVAVPLAAAAGIVALLVAGPIVRGADPEPSEAAVVTPAPSAETTVPGAPAALAPFGSAESEQTQSPSPTSDASAGPTPSTGLTPTSGSVPTSGPASGPGPATGAGQTLGAGQALDAPRGAPHRPAAPTTDQARRHTAEEKPAKTASPRPTITITSPQSGDAVAATATVAGRADPADGHQIWLFSRSGSGSAYRVESRCQGTREFSCDLTRPAEGEEKFRLAVVVVDPTTAVSLRAGENWETLPRHAAHDEIAVRHQKA